MSDFVYVRKKSQQYYNFYYLQYSILLRKIFQVALEREVFFLRRGNFRAVTKPWMLELGLYINFQSILITQDCSRHHSVWYFARSNVQGCCHFVRHLQCLQ